MPDPAVMRATVERYVERHTAGDIDGIVACFAPDASAEDPIGSPAHVGTEALRAFFEGTHSLADRLELKLTGLIRTAANFAAFPMQAISTIGDMTLVVEIIDVMTFDEDGRITDMKAYWSMDDAHPL
jgi:steroid delta-isomerase